MRYTIITSLLLIATTRCFGAVGADYTLTVGPNQDLWDWYLSRPADMIAIFDTLPSADNKFKAGSGSVVDSKPHSSGIWIEKLDEALIYEAKSPPIPKDATSWVKCAGEFQVVSSPGAAPALAPTWKTQLKEKPGHIILVHQYTGPVITSSLRTAQNLTLRVQGQWFYNSYSEGGARFLVTIGLGSDIANIHGLGGLLATKDITAKSVVTVDDLGHGTYASFGPISAGESGTDEEGNPIDTRTETSINAPALVSANSGALIAVVNNEIAVGDLVMDPFLAGKQDLNGNTVLTASQYTGQYRGYLRDDAKVDLLHCFSADHGQMTVTTLATTTPPTPPTVSTTSSVAEQFKAALGGSIKVTGYQGPGVLTFPGNSAPEGVPVTF